MIVTTDIDVLVIPQWIIDLIGDENEEIIHPTSSAKLSLVTDPDGDKIIGLSVLNDSDWSFLGEDENGNDILLTSPEGVEGHLRDHLTTKKHKYEEIEI